ncbi:MAG: lysophospholipid acyltransferase family protein [Alphaproteobacteria bacterium]|nr:lysophospholipid acyltransferase family protein [Alphaproteobacteria bacterium]
MSGIRQAKRSLLQKFFLDPLVGLGVGFLYVILKLLPLRASRWFGGFLGSIAYYLVPCRNKIALKNMDVAFPEKSRAEKIKILKGMWRHFGMLFAEVPHNKEVLAQVTFENTSVIKDAYLAGKGGFICSAHFGNWELPVAEQVIDGFHMNPVYRAANNPWLDKLLFQRREGVKIPKGTQGARLMIETLQKGGFISILCDQKLREGIEVPFFGKPAMTASAIFNLSIKKGAPVIMVNAIRQPNKRYHLTVCGTIPVPETGTFQEKVYAMTLCMNHIYEDWIRTNPEQWLWIHRRFEKPFYKEDGTEQKPQQTIAVK